MSSSRLHIFALGESFDVDAFAEDFEKSFTVNRVWHRGDIDARPGRILPLSNGVEIFLTEDEKPPPLPEQQQIAIGFLEKHAADLLRMTTFPGVETTVLALHYPISIGENVFSFAMAPRHALMKLCVATRISPTFYVWLDRSDVITEGSPKPQ